MKRGTKPPRQGAARRRSPAFFHPEVHRLEDRLPPGRVFFSGPEPGPAAFDPVVRPAGVNDSVHVRVLPPGGHEAAVRRADATAVETATDKAAAPSVAPGDRQVHTATAPAGPLEQNPFALFQGADTFEEGGFAGGSLNFGRRAPDPATPAHGDAAGANGPAQTLPVSAPSAASSGGSSASESAVTNPADRIHGRTDLRPDSLPVSARDRSAGIPPAATDPAGASDSYSTGRRRKNGSQGGPLDPTPTVPFIEIAVGRSSGPQAFVWFVDTNQPPPFTNQEFFLTINWTGFGHFDHGVDVQVANFLARPNGVDNDLFFGAASQTGDVYSSEVVGFTGEYLYSLFPPGVHGITVSWTDIWANRFYESQPFGAARGGVRLGAGPVGVAGQDDLLVSAGPGYEPRVNIYHYDPIGHYSYLLGSFLAFDPSYTGGVSVAAGLIDVRGSSRADIATGTITGSDLVYVYNYYNAPDYNHPTLLTAAHAYSGYATGVSLASGREIDGPNGPQDAVITGTSPGSYAEVKTAYYNGVLDFDHPAVDFWPYSYPPYGDPGWPGWNCGVNVAYSDLFVANHYYIVAGGPDNEPGYVSDYRYVGPNGGNPTYRDVLGGMGGAFVTY